MLLTAEKATGGIRQRSGQIKSRNPTDRATESFYRKPVFKINDFKLHLTIVEGSRSSDISRDIVWSLKSVTPFLSCITCNEVIQGVACEGRSAKKSPPLAYNSRFALASLSPLFAWNTQKNTPVLQAIQGPRRGRGWGGRSLAPSLHFFEKLKIN